LAIVHLHDLAERDHRQPLHRVHFQKAACHTPPEIQLVWPDIVALALGEAVEKHRLPANPERHQGSITAAAAALPRPGDALVDEAAAKVGIHQTAPGALGSFAKPCVADALAPRKAREFLGLENPQAAPLRTIHPT